MQNPSNFDFVIQSVFESLEERVLFDGVPDAAFIVHENVAGQPSAQVQQQQQVDSQASIELIIIDAGVQDRERLVSEIIENKSGRTFEIQLLSNAEDGVTQITDILAQSETRYDAIHILSHGDDGEIQLGNSSLSNDNFNRYVDQLAQWSDVLTDDADLLLYGCNLAGHETGLQLLDSISAVTGADVAASDDLTGSDQVGGDWQLEIETGEIESMTLDAGGWLGVLAIEATDGIVTVQDAENSAAGTITITNDGAPETVTVLNTPTRVGQMLERVYTFNETADTGRATFVFDVSGIAGINATIASEFGLIVSDQPNLADGPNTTTLVASGYDAANGLVFFHQVDLSDGDFFGLATEVVQDNFSINPTATGPEDTAIDLGLTLSPSLIDGGQLQDIIATEAGFRASTAGTNSTDFFIPAGTTGIRITGFSTRDIGTGAADEFNDDYQFLNASIDLATETSNGFIGHIIDQGPARSDQFAFEEAPLGVSVLTGGGTIVGDADNNIDPTFSIVDGVLQITENHQLQTAYHVEFLTNATSSAEFIRTESAVLESGDQSLATLSIPTDADFLVVNITDAAAGANFAIESKGNSRIVIDLATLRASGVVAAQQGETDNRVVSYAFEDYDVSSVGVGSILSAAGTVVGDAAGQATVINDNQIYIDANGDLVIDRNDDFAGAFNSLITVEYLDRRDVGSSAEQLGESSAYGLFNSDPSNPISTLEFDIPENAAVGIFNLTFNGTNSSDTNENSGAAFAIIDLVNETSSGSIYFVRASNVADLVGFDSVPFGTAFFDDPSSISNHNSLNDFNDPFGGTAEFNLINGGTTLQFAANSDSGNTGTFLDYFAGAQVEFFGAAPFEISGFANGGSFSQGTLNPVTGNFELTIAEAQNGLSYIPPTHVSGNMPVDVTLRIGDEAEVTSVTVQAVIDPIDFGMAPDACGHEDTDISISANVTPVFIDQDGSETLTAQVLSNIPIGHTLTDGTNVFVSSAANQSVDITAWDTTTITYRANPNESGTFTITIDADFQDVGGGVTDTSSVMTTFDVVVKPLNDVPVAVNDNYTVLGNTTLTINAASGVLNNDSDVDGDTLTVTGVVSGPTVGTVMLNPDGSFVYIPPMGFSGTASFDYEVSDGNGGFATATAFIDVSVPVTGPLDAMDDFVTTNEETLINIAVMNNDDLPTTGAFNIQSTTPPSNGSITVLPDGTIDYTPNLNFFGTDTFTYTLADASGRTSTATVTVTVVNVQDPPVANSSSGSTPEDTTLPNIDVLANDSDPDNDPLTVTTATAPNGTVVINADGTVDYTPNPGFNGTDVISYTISDGNGGTASSTVLINVVPVADPPTSADNTVTTDEEIAYTFVSSDFAFADQDPGDSLVAVRIDTLPADGQLLLNGNPVVAGQVISSADIANGNLLFVPDPDDFGNNYTTFDFSVTDGVLFQTTPNTMTINVNPIQDPPIATDNAITVAEDSVANPLGLAPPTDVDGDTLTATVTGLPTQGTVFLADGVTPVNNGDVLTVAQLTTLVYDAPATFTVPNAGSFTYDITDGIATDSGQVDITITPVNDPPLVDLNGGPAGEDFADTFIEGGAPVGVTDPTVTVTDEDDIRLALLKIDVDETTIVDAGEEFLVIGGVDFQLDAAANSTTAVTIGTTSYDVMFDAATARFDIVRTDGIEMTLAQSQVVLSRITYRNDSVLPTVGDRDFHVCVSDGDTDSNIATSTITVARDAETAVWSITGPATVIDGNNATFVLELSDPLRDGEIASVDIGLMDIDTNAADLGAFNAAVNAAVAAYAGPGSLTWNGTSLTFTSDGTGTMAPLSIVVPTTPDGVFEGDEDFKVSLTNPASSTGETISIDPAAGEVITTIIDNTVAPTLMIGDGMAVEGSPVVFNLTLDVPSFEPITFDLAAATGSATAGADFETTNFEFFDGTTWQPAVAGTQVTISAGQTSLMIRVDTVQEGLVEQDETFTLSATAISGTLTNSNDTGTGTIINDDVPQISVDDVTVDEDNGTLTFTVSLDQAPVDLLTVDFATASGTATSGVDFTASTGTLNFAPGAQTQTVTIAITDDNIFEGPHSFDLNLSNPTNGTILDGTGVGTIIDDGTGPNGSDDDRPVISIDDVTATEDIDMFAVFTVSLSNPSIENIVLTPTLIGGSAVAGTDFGPGLEFFDGTAWQAVTGNITIAAGDTSIMIRTAIIDDPIADSGETYTVMVAHVSGTTANTGDTGTGTILDEAMPDATLVSITGPPSVTEGNAAIYTVEIDNVPLTDVTVTFTYTGTASGGTDYTGVASVTIPAGSTIATVTIPTIDDTLGEPLENFTIAINSVTGGSLEDIQIDPTDFEVTTDIIDDDVPKISVSDVVVTEGFDPFAVFTVELSNPTFEAIDFGLTATGVTANGETVDFGILGLNELEVFDGTNYVPATSASFAPGATTIQLRTPIVDDALAEVLETFTVTATVTGGTTCNASASGTGTILDDTTDPEVVLVSLTGPPSVVEGATTSPYTLTLTGPGGLPINAAEDITVTLAYTGVAADGSDFTGVATVVIPVGSGSGTFTLPTVNDSLFEGNEDIIISIDDVTGGGFEGIATDPMADTVTTLIIDDADIPTVSVNNVTSIEGTDNFAVYTIELSNLSVEDIDVNLALAGGTAAGGGVDFGASGAGNLQVFNGTTWVDATTATIAAGDQFVQVRTPIVDDPIDEPTENYTLTVDVTAGTTTNIQVIGNGTILDDDPAPNVTIDDATATEGDQLVFNVTLSNPSSQPIVLDFSAADNTTSGTADFAQTFEFSTDGGLTWMAAVAGSEVTIPANSNGVLVRTLTTEDTTLETTETLELSIASVVSGTVGNTSDTATGTIIDDDTALVSIVANDPLAGEPNNDAQFTVTMTNPSDSPTVIAYTVTGTASSGIDFSALPGTITLPAGSTSGTIDLSVIDDLIIEGNENVTITLTSIVSGDANISIDAANDFDTATITDNDNAVWQLTGVTSVNEGAIATYQVELNGTLQAGEAASVELSIGDNSTTSADYASFNTAVATAVAAYAGPGSVAWDGTTLTFTSDGTGEMAPLVIDLMAVNDAIVEGVDDYTVSIAGAASTTGIAVGIDVTNNSVTTEIQDTIDAAGTSLDKASFSIAGATSVNESQTTDYTITIDATLQTGEIATVDIQLTDVDTTSGDVTALNVAVTAAVATYNSSGQPGSLAWNGTTLEFTSDGTGPMGNLIVQIQATADGFLEGPEDYTLSLANPGSTTGAAVCLDAAMDSVTTTIQPDATAAWWSIGVDNGGDESATVQYTISLTESFGAGESATVNLAVNDVDTNSSDYSNFVLAVNNAVAGYTGPGTLAFDGTTLTFTAVADGDAMTDLVIDLILINDALAEGTETFTVDLMGATGPTGVNVDIDAMADRVTTTINDTMGLGGAPDQVVFSIMGPASGPEGTSVQYVVGLSGALGAGESVSVNIALNDIDTTSSDYASFTASVTAAAAADPNVTFNAATGELTYTAPTDGATLTPLLIDLGLSTDAIVEGDEDFEIELSGATSTTGVAVSIDSAKQLVTTTISDATAPLVWRIVGPAFADEGGTAQYLIVLDGTLGAGETATVQIDLNDITTNSNDYAAVQAAVAAAVAADPNVAFDNVTGVLTYTSPSDGATLAPIVVDLGITDDVIIEGPEQFEIVLSSPGSTTGAAVQLSATMDSVTTTINDRQGLGGDPDGPAEWSIAGNTSVVEGVAASYTIGLTGAFGAGESVSVDLGFSDVDTTSADYANFVAAVNVAVANYTGPGTVTFDGTTLTFEAGADGDSMDDLIVVLPTIDDALIEGAEDYTIALTGATTTTGANVAIEAAAQSVTTTIIDNDTATWSITGDLTVGEGATARYTIELAGTLQAGETATIDLGIADVDTTSADYANFVAAVNAAIVGRPDLAFDGTTLTYTGDGNPMADLIIDVAAIDDAIIEGDEDYTVSISNPGSTTGGDVATGGMTSVTTTITDNDTAIWNITGDPAVAEGATAQYTVALTGTLQAGEMATIDVGLADVATNSADYANFVAAVNAAIAGRTDLAFDGTTLTYTADGNPLADLIIDLDAIDDVLVEGAEDYNVSISNPGSTTGGSIAVGTNTVNTIISDNDQAAWSLTGDTSVAEGGTAQYTIALDATLQLGETATIDIGLTDVDTTSADYTNFVAAVNAAIAGRPELTFDGTTLTFTSDGNPLADIVISLPTVDDTLSEGTESYNVDIANPGSTTGGDVATGGTTSVTTTITDNDTAIWNIVGDSTIGEGATARYTIELTGTLQAGETATIDLGFGDVATNSADHANFVAAVNAAVAGRSDLAFDGTTLTYTGDGNPMADLIIDLATIDDVLVEGAEDYNVSISNPSSTTGGSIAVGTNTVNTIISDNDLAIWSLTGDTSVAEGDTAQYTVALDGILQVGETATIDLGLTDVDTSSADYADFVAAVNAAIAGRPELAFDGTTLTFTSDGNPLADIVISLPTVDDLLSEGTESFNIDITNAGSTTGSSVVGTGLLNTTILDNDADLVTTKTLLSGDSTPAEGDAVTFEIVVTNSGAGDATNVSLIDQLPAGITLTSFTVSQGSYNAATGVWSIGSLGSLDVATLTLTGNVDVGQGGNTITNTTTAAATPDQTDPTTAGDDLTESITVDSFADLVTVKTLISGDTTPAEGDTVTYQIEVTNSGAAQATNVALVDQLPAGLTLTSSSLTQGTYDEATGLWSIGTLDNGATVTLTLSGTVDVGGGGNTITNTTTAAAGDQPDPTGGSDDLSVSFTIENLADLETRKSLVSGDSTPAEGDTVTYEIVVTNNGAAQATNVSLVDQLPAGLTLAGADFPPGTTYDAATGLWNIGTLNSGATVTLTLSGTVDVGQGGNTITNTTTAAAGDQPDPTAAGDDLSESFTVENLSDLVTVKTLTSGDKTPNEGDTITYQILVANNGAAQATNVSLIDQLPVGVTLTGSTLTQGTYDSATGLWNIGTLADGATATLTLTATVDVGFGGTTITNTTTEATSDQDDPTSSGDNLSVSVSAQRPELTFEKQTTAVVPSGDNFDVTFELLLTNTGTVDLTGINLVDDLATQLGPAFNGVVSVTIDTSAVSAAAPPTLNSAYDGAGVVSLLNNDGTLAVGDTLIVNLVVSIDPDASGDSGGLSNQATASGVDPDGNEFTDASDDPDNLASDNDPTPINIADVAVAKTVVGQPVPNGQAFDVTFELILENTGTVDLVGIDLFDDLATHFGAAFVGLVGSPSLDVTGINGGTAPTLNLAFDGVSTINLLNNDGLLSTGDFLSVVFTVTIDPDASGSSTSLSNQATGAGDGPSGLEVTDLSDAGNDPNSNNGSGTSDDWTTIAIPDLAVVKSVVGDPVPNGDNFDVTFDVILENTGTVDLTGVDLLDDLRAQLGPAFVGLSGTPVLDVSSVGSGLPPTLNSNFDGATDINLLNNDGVLAAGDFIVVTFTVTVDPDADGQSGGLQNQAVGAADDPTGAEFTDLSDSGSDPSGDNDDGSFDDATSIVIADLGLAKSLVGQPVKLDSGNFSATYQLVVSNTGTTDVANLSLVEDLQTQFGAAFFQAGGLEVVNQPTIAGSTITLNANWDGGSVADLLDPTSPSLLRVGDSFLLEFTVELDGSEIGNASLENSVAGSGTAVDASGNSILDSNGQPIIATDVSDSGNDPSGTNSGEQGDTGGSGDPTPLFLPSVGLAKRAGDAVANGENFDVTFVLVFQNNGNVDLNALSIVDDVESEFGNAFVSVSNAQLQNFVGSGTSPTINSSWSANTSQSIVSGGQVGVGDSFEIVFTVTLDPDAAGDSLELENRASATGAAIDSAGNPIRDSSGGQLIATDDSDNGNTADSENGEANTDGIFGNDPTPVVIADLGIAKSIAGEPAELANGNVLVTFLLVVENTGTVDLENLSLLEDLAAQFGSPFVNAGNLVLVSGPSDPGSSVSLNSAGFNGTSNIELLNQLSNNILQTGDSFEIEFNVEIDPSLVTDELENRVIGRGDAVDENGDSILLSGGTVASAFDLSDTGLSPNNSNPAALGDTGALDDPTIVPIPVSENNGASGNPPRIPGLPPIAFVPISQFLNGPGTIYSGIPIDSNISPLSFDSGRPVTGGYVGIDSGFGDCGCEQIESVELDFCDPYDEFANGSSMSVVPTVETDSLTEAVDTERVAELQNAVKEGVVEDQELPTEATPQSESLEPANHAADIESEDERAAGNSSDVGHVENTRQPFLKRFSQFSDWLKARGTT